MKIKIVFTGFLSILLTSLFHPSTGFSQDEPAFLRDRGTGIPLSQFGTYVRKGELLIYPFYEYYRDHNAEYEAAEFGYEPTQEQRGRYRAHEGLIFIGYGITDRLAVEFEAAVISAKLYKSDKDLSAMPSKIDESGLGDVEGQIRWRWNHENARTPEVFTYFETVFPTAKKNSLIGTTAWEYKLGTGLVKGFRWGTLTARAAVEYDGAEKKTEVGEFAIEYLKKISDHFRFFVMMEGAQDEIELVPEIQWHISPSVFLKANTGFGVTSKATDFAPEVGIAFLLQTE